MCEMWFLFQEQVVHAVFKIYTVNVMSLHHMPHAIISLYTVDLHSVESIHSRLSVAMQHISYHQKLSNFMT